MIKKLLDCCVTTLQSLLTSSDVPMEESDKMLDRVWDLSNEICGSVNAPHR